MVTLGTVNEVHCGTCSRSHPNICAFSKKKKFVACACASQCTHGALMCTGLKVGCGIVGCCDDHSTIIVIIIQCSTGKIDIRKPSSNILNWWGWVPRTTNYPGPPLAWENVLWHLLAPKSVFGSYLENFET